MIEFLGNIQPIILLFMLVLMYSIENIFPYLEKPDRPAQHYKRNYGTSVISFVVNALMGAIVVMAIVTANHKQIGLLNLVNIPKYAKIIIGILLFDFGSYLTHNLQHRIPLLWRFHRVHHSDFHLNSSSSLRFHPVDVIVSQCIYQSLGAIVIGLPVSAFVIYGTIAIPLLIMQHSNVRLPQNVERVACLIFATPCWHKIHHSTEQPLTDSHYGDVFSLWDRLFGTWGYTKPHEIKYGLDEFKSNEQHQVWYLLKSPVKNNQRLLDDQRQE
ncbi:sterol desaturase family protein [Mucilaginibacter sp. E4BP6]|uniref:sterol desaturase family protein n=1 Tax=Mucilaginibacter sp. E4BP6 TaxID=2723089 RepID=UPI0015CCE061|nr:sterol desaturase family protein [Mucilaginibacter sp. E4BP6]NYE67043.1 sterol desaturase/sphingolipid hydroxylase (fatty acid hydroxylase superfamily) [Mucilaginibacter sp. E4BP6]